MEILSNYRMLLVIGIIFIFILLFIYSFIQVEKNLKKTKNLFNNKLIKLCYDAGDINECNEAWKILMSECLDENNNHFKIPKAYHQDFYELRNILMGKLSILQKQ